MFEPEDEVSLADVSGLTLSWDADGTLEFAESMIAGDIQAYSLEQLQSVALDPVSCQPPKQVQVWHYSDVMRRRDRERIGATGLHYNLTLLQPNPIGRERAKTVGQIYNLPHDSSLSYPAVCEVLSGSAWFVFQLSSAEEKSAPFCAVLQAHPRDKIVIPPNLHYVAVNAGEAPLLFSTVTSMAARSSSQAIANLQGAAWFNLVDQGWIKNPTYRHVAELTWWAPQSHPEMGITPNRPLYQNLTQLPETLLWLLEPMSFPDIFPDVWDGLASVMNAQ